MLAQQRRSRLARPCAVEGSTTHAHAWWCACHRRAYEHLACFPLFARFERLEELHVLACEGREGHSIAKEDAIARKSGELRPGRYDAHKVERISTRHRHKRGGLFLATHFAQ